MYKKFLKTISTISTIILTLLGGTATSIAMWDEIDPDAKQRIQAQHCQRSSSLQHSSTLRFGEDPGVRMGSSLPYHPGDVWTVMALYQLLQVEAANYHNGQWNSNAPQQCQACQSAIKSEYFNSVLPQKLTQITAAHTLLQQQHTETLLEMEELKDDIQRLKAELRAATQQPSPP